MTTGSPAPDAGSEVAAVLGRAAAGEPFAEIRRALTPAEWTPVLARVAAVEQFDEDLFVRLLGAGPDQEPGLGTLTDLGLVEAVPGHPGWSAMAPDDRAVWAYELAPGERQRLSASLAAALLARGDKLEALRHLVLVDPPRATALLDELFGAADAELDLPRCRNILRTAQPEGRSIGTAMADELADRTAYLNARSLWLPDYYQSALFLRPPGLAESSRGLIDGDAPVWEIAAQGGLGKSMLVRWLLAREWVPGRIPCARVDYDSVDAVMCVRYPFLTLLLAAEQLAPQLVRNPFSTLLRSYEPFLVLARLSAPGPEDIDPAEALAAGDGVVDLFVAGCRADGDRTVVIVLDTLEEISQRYPDETGALVRMLAEVAARVPGLRLVFAGRYAVPQVGESFPRVRPVEVAPFDDARAEEYLLRVRGIDDPDRRRDLVRRSAGVPFVLALYADLVSQDPGIVLDEVAQQNPQLVYLVDRVIDRIREPAVRWLLRYGCVPRRLTLGYVLDVLAPFVVQGASGDSRLDDPLRDPITAWYGRPLFPNDLGDLRGRLVTAWESLERYVSSSSWITPAPGEPSARTYVIKAEVLAPMRAILAGRPVLRALHRRSAEYALAEADAHPARRIRHFRDALYHLAQAGSPDLPPRWQAMADAVRDDGDYAGLIDLCAEFGRSEYTGPDGEPLAGWDGDPMVPERIRVEAGVWSDYAQVAIAVRDELAEKVPGLRALGWRPDTSDRRLGGLESSRKRLSRTALDLVACADGTRNGHPESAAAYWLWTTSTGDLRRTAGFLWALATRDDHGREDPAVLAEVTDLALTSSQPDDARIVCQVLAGRLVEAGDVGAAVGWTDRVSAAGGRLWDRYLDLLTRQGTPDETFAEVTPEGTPIRAGHPEIRARARAMAALRSPAEALRALRAGMASLDETVTSTAVRLRERAEYLGSLGRVLGALARVDEATTCFEQAAGLLRELGHPHGETRTVRAYGEMLLRQAGDVVGTKRLLELALEKPGREGDLVRIRLLLAEAYGRGGDQTRAQELLATESVRAGHTSRTRGLQAAVALAALITTGDVERYGPDVLHAAADLRPPASALGLLEDLRWAEPYDGRPLAASPIDRILGGGDGPPGRRAVRDLQRAYVLRALAPDRGQEVEFYLHDALAHAPGTFLAWEIVRFLGAGAAPAAVDAVRRTPPEEAAPGVLLLRRGQQALRDDDPAEADRLALEAMSAFESTAGKSAWMADGLLLRAAVSASRGDPEAARRFADQAGGRYERLGVQPRTAEAGPATQPERVGDELIVTDAHVRGLDYRVAGDLRGALRAAEWTQDLPVPAERTVRVESVDVETLARPWEEVARRAYRSLPMASSVERDRFWLAAWLARIGGPPAKALRSEAEAVLDSGRPLAPELRRRLEQSIGAGPRPRVLIVRASRDIQRSWGYGSGDRGLDLVESYRDAGWDVLEARAQDIADGRAEGGLPHLIHIQGVLSISHSLTGYFDMTSESYEQRGGQLSGGGRASIHDTDIVRWLYYNKGERRRAVGPPALLLDPVVPPNSGSMEVAVLARNRLAASIYCDAPVIAVVAAGLLAAPVPMQESWLRGVNAGRPLLDVVGEMREYADPRTPIALFAPSATFGLRGAAE